MTTSTYILKSLSEAGKFQGRRRIIAQGSEKIYEYLSQPARIHCIIQVYAQRLVTEFTKELMREFSSQCSLSDSWLSVKQQD
jgi:hypothetical protein